MLHWQNKHHFKSKIEELLAKDDNFQILKHLHENPNCRQVSNFNCSDGIDCDNSHFRLQLKEAMHVTWKQTLLNKQMKNVTLTISV